MMYKAKVAVCSDFRTKHSTQSERHVEFLNVKPWWDVKKPLGVKRLKMVDLIIFLVTLPSVFVCVDGCLIYIGVIRSLCVPRQYPLVLWCIGWSAYARACVYITLQFVISHTLCRNTLRWLLRNYLRYIFNVYTILGKFKTGNVRKKQIRSRVVTCVHCIKNTHSRLQGKMV